jgi:transcriptional regulator with XRE-family HTH domain
MKVKIDSINVYLGNEIRKMREGRGYTQNEFSEMCGISRAYYGRIERGEYNVTVEMCHRIADALGCHISELFINLPV